MTHPTEVKPPESLEAIRVALPMLPASLLNTIGEYGMARTDRVSELTVQYRWKLLLAGIKDYTAAQVKARDAEIERLRGALSQIANLDPGAPIVRGSDEWYATVANAAKMIAIDQARAEGGEKK